MQDIVVYIKLDTAAQEKETLMPLILTLEGESDYAEYTSAEAVAADFSTTSSPARKAAEAIFSQAKIEKCPGRVKKVAILGLDSSSTTAEVTTALDELRESHDDWYFLIPVGVLDTYITALASWVDGTVLTAAQLEAGDIESEKLLVAQTSSKTVITDTLKEKKQTVICYNHAAATTYMNAAWVGRMAAHYPEAVTWKWKELYGIPVTTETGTDMHELLESRYNMYIGQHGYDYTSEGICVDGDFIDTVISRWSIKKKMREALAKLFVETEDIPYDDDGFAQVGGVVVSALNAAVKNGSILRRNGIGEFSVNIPRREDATTEQASNRIMPPITWEATLRGSVHGVKVSGVLTIALVAATA